MKSGSTVVRMAWILLGLLAVGSAAFELGRPKTNEQPYASSFDPSGAAAFAEMLRQDGYQVQISTLLPASLRSNVLAISFVQREEISSPLEERVSDTVSSMPAAKKSADSSGGDEDSEIATATPLAPSSIRLIVDHLRKGGNAIILGYNPKLDLKEDHPVARTVVDPAGHSYNLIFPAGVGIYSEDLANADAVLPAWLFAEQAVANLDQIGTGRAVVLDDGELAMNSFIDQSDNSRLLLDQVHLLAPKGAVVEILDGSLNGSAGGLIEALGPWAQGVQLQLILVGIVIVYALGKRFGLADETPRLQRGARDLLDGIADTYNRGHAAKAGLQAVLEEADRAVRRQLKLPSDAPLRKRNELLTPAAAQVLTACEHGLMQDLKPFEALTLARHLETELELFLRHRKPAAKRTRRRVNSA